MDIPYVIALLQSKGLSQYQIAAATGYTQGSISNILNYKQGTLRPSVKLVDGLRKLLAETKLTEAG